MVFEFLRKDMHVCTIKTFSKLVVKKKDVVKTLYKEVLATQPYVYVFFFCGVRVCVREVLGTRYIVRT
jgi:hypothetical protein